MRVGTFSTCAPVAVLDTSLSPIRVRAQVEWQLNGRVVSFSDAEPEATSSSSAAAAASQLLGYRTSSSSLGRALTMIKRVERNENYTCVAENELGISRFTVRVIVRGTDSRLYTLLISVVEQTPCEL